MTPAGQGACLLLSQSCILNCFLFLPSALFFLPVYLQILVVFSHLAETIRLLLVGQQSLLKPIQEASLCSSCLPGEVLLGLCCRALWLILCSGVAACVSLPGAVAFATGHVRAASPSAQLPASCVPYPRLGFPSLLARGTVDVAGHAGTSWTCAAHLGMLQPLQHWKSLCSFC